MGQLNQYINKLKEKIPSREDLFKSKWLKPLEKYFNKSYYWSFNRKNIAKAVAIGMFCGLMPGPTQILSAFLLAYLLRTNISFAVFTTLYTNPFTYIPLYYLAYKIGVQIIEGSHSANHMLSMQVITSWNFEQFMSWLSNSLGYLMVGVPILGIILATIGYYTVLYLWKLKTLSKRSTILEQRKQNKMSFENKTKGKTIN